MSHSKQNRARTIKQHLRGGAAWAVLPAIAMITPVGVMVDAHYSPARAACAAGVGTYTGSASTVTLNSACPTNTFTGTTSVSSGNGVYGAAGTTWKVTNNGTITASDNAGNGLNLAGTASTVINTGSVGNTGTAGAGVNFTATGASLTNSGVIAIAPGVSGNTHSAVAMNNGGSVTNSGTISGGWNAVFAQNAAGTLTNTGTVFSNDPAAFGVWFIAGGKVDNKGGITGNATGVGIAYGLGTVLNSGTIINVGTSFSSGAVYL